MTRYLLIYSMALIFTACIQHEKSKTVDKSQSELPPISFLLMDSGSLFSVQDLAEKKPVILLFFNTTCDHCQKEAVSLVKHKKSLEKVNLIMVSSENVELVKQFYSTYSLSEIKSLIIGMDYQNSGIQHFRFESFPFCALYTSSFKYIRSFERNFTTEDLLNELKSKGEL